MLCSTQYACSYICKRYSLLSVSPIHDFLWRLGLLLVSLPTFDSTGQDAFGSTMAADETVATHAPEDDAIAISEEAPSADLDQDADGPSDTKRQKLGDSEAALRSKKFVAFHGEVVCDLKTASHEILA